MEKNTINIMVVVVVVYVRVCVVVRVDRVSYGGDVMMCVAFCFDV